MIMGGSRPHGHSPDMGLRAGSLHRPAGGPGYKPPVLAPTIVGGRGMPSPRRPEAGSPKLGRLASVFPAILYDAGPSVISQRYWITGISGLNSIKATAKHRPAQRGTRWETYGAPETGAAHARQEAPIPRPPGGSWWAPIQARHTLGGQAAARGTRASRPEAHHEPGRVGDR